MIKYPHSLPQGITFLGKDCVRKTAIAGDEKYLELIEAICNHFMKRPDPKVVPVYKFGVKGKENGMWWYYYDMMLMGMLSNEEKRAITILDRKWACGKVPFPQSKDPEVIKTCEAFPKLSKFMLEILMDGRYFDTHSGNVMIDLEEDYRLIDLEGFMLHGIITHPKNAWIIRDPSPNVEKVAS